MRLQLARDVQELASKEKSIGGRDMKPAQPGEDISLVVEALDRANGSRLWKYSIPVTGEFPEFNEKHDLATATPVTDGKPSMPCSATDSLSHST